MGTRYLVAVAAGLLASSSAHANEPQDVARQIMSGRASILIVGDSTNNPEGAGSFVPYYEGLLRRLPSSVELCGFRTSATLGRTALNGYVLVSGGTSSQMQGGTVYLRTPQSSVAFGPFVPPGYRNEFRLNTGGSLLSYARFVSAAFNNLNALLTNHPGWGVGEDLTLRTRFVTGPSELMVDQISAVPLTSGPAVGQVFTPGQAFETVLAAPGRAWGIGSVDVRFPEVVSNRVGVEFRGDASNNDVSEESARSVAWCGHLLFDEGRAASGRGLFLDSIAIGGFSARDFEQTLSVDSLAMYLAQSPRPVSLIIVWLGQNMEQDEWTGVLQPAWSQRIEAIADRAIAASIQAGATEAPAVLVVTPPQVTGESPYPPFVAVGGVLDILADRRSWSHLNMFGMLGSSLEQINAGYPADGAHPSLAGSEFVADRFYQQMACLSSDLNDDGERNFIDILEFLARFGAADPVTDFNGDNRTDFLDVIRFIELFQVPCIAD